MVANKLDKLKKSEIEPNLLRIRTTLQLDDSVKVIPFSAEKKIGRRELYFLVTGEDRRTTESDIALTAAKTTLT